METIQETKPAIYVGTYRKYNEGSIAGKWIDLTEFVDYEAFLTDCKTLHADEEDPEYMIQDFESFPEIFYSESGLPSEAIFDNIRKYAEMDSDQQPAFEAWTEMTGADEVTDDDIFDKFEEAFTGVYDSPKEYAEQFIEETGGIPDDLPDIIKNNIDYEGIAEEFRISGDVWYAKKDGKTYVFQNQ